MRTSTLALLLLASACASDESIGTGGQAAATSTTGSGNTTTSVASTVAATTGAFGTGSGGFMPVPVRALPNLVSITYYERSGGTEPTAYTFAIAGPEMTTFLATLSDAEHDIKGVESEFYDVYYSDADGVFDIDGAYLTISGVFAYALPAGGGLNLAEIALNYADASVEYGSYVASAVSLGDNASAGSEANAIDGDLQTHSTMGNTVGQTERLRITLGFESSSGPPS